MTTLFRSSIGLRGTVTVRLLVTFAFIAALLTSAAGTTDAAFDQRCERRPVTCDRVERWANLKLHQFRDGELHRTPDRYIRGLWRYYKAAWDKEHGRGISTPEVGAPQEADPAAPAPDSRCWGWAECFAEFVDRASCIAHPTITTRCATTTVLDDGIGFPEQATLVCAGRVLVTAGRNPIAVGPGLASCYWESLGWLLFD
jgi:hypothetical protein